MAGRRWDEGAIEGMSGYDVFDCTFRSRDYKGRHMKEVAQHERNKAHVACKAPSATFNLTVTNRRPSRLAFYNTYIDSRRRRRRLVSQNTDLVARVSKRTFY